MPDGRFCYQGPVDADSPFWLFDLDNTLYPAENGLFAAVDERINGFLTQHLGVDGPTADRLRRRYHDEYGITLVGLMAEHGVDPHHYLDFVHSVPVADFLETDPGLRGVLLGLPGRKTIFTNGSRRHALAVTAALGLVGVFEEIFDIAVLGFRPKPDPETYRSVLRSLGARAVQSILVEDLERNLAPARALGMRTVLVGAAGPSASADFAVRSVREIPGILPGLVGG